MLWVKSIKVAFAKARRQDRCWCCPVSQTLSCHMVLSSQPDIIMSRTLHSYFMQVKLMQAEHTLKTTILRICRHISVRQRLGPSKSLLESEICFKIITQKMCSREYVWFALSSAEFCLQEVHFQWVPTVKHKSRHRKDLHGRSRGGDTSSAVPLFCRVLVMAWRRRDFDLLVVGNK